jgi:hypothetical protein
MPIVLVYVNGALMQVKRSDGSMQSGWIGSSKISSGWLVDYSVNQRQSVALMEASIASLLHPTKNGDFIHLSV